jgi:hypothetical protein
MNKSTLQYAPWSEDTEDEGQPMTDEQAGASPRQAGGAVSPSALGPVTVPHDHPILRYARQAADGNYYVPDPRRPGKYLRVAAPQPAGRP